MHKPLLPPSPSQDTAGPYLPAGSSEPLLTLVEASAVAAALSGRDLFGCRRRVGAGERGFAGKGSYLKHISPRAAVLLPALLQVGDVYLLLQGGVVFDLVPLLAPVAGGGDGDDGHQEEGAAARQDDDHDQRDVPLQSLSFPGAGLGYLLNTGRSGGGHQEVDCGSRGQRGSAIVCHGEDDLEQLSQLFREVAPQHNVPSARVNSEKVLLGLFQEGKGELSIGPIICISSFDLGHQGVTGGLAGHADFH